MIFQFPYKLISFAKMLSSGYLIVVLVTIVTIYGQNFDDYFDEPEETFTSPPSISTTSLTETSQLPILTTTSPLPSISTSSLTEKTLRTTSTTARPIQTATTTISTTPTTALPIQTTTAQTTSTTTTCVCNEKISPILLNLIKETILNGCEKMEKSPHPKIETTTSTTASTTTTTTDPMNRFLEDVFVEFEDNNKPSKPTTTDDDEMSRFLEDVFTEFEENIKPKLGKRNKNINENWPEILMVSLSLAAAGLTVLLMVTLFLCLERKRNLVNGEESNQERGINLHIYEEVGPAKVDVPLEDVPLVPLDVPFIDEALEGQ